MKMILLTKKSGLKKIKIKILNYNFTLIDR